MSILLKDFITSLKDVYGRILEVTEFTSNGVFTTRYDYDIQGNLIKTTDAAGNITQIWYDSAGRKLKMIDPDTCLPIGMVGTWTYKSNPQVSL